MIEIKNQTHSNEGISPLCPYCSTEIREINMQEVKGVFGKRYIYYCSQCRKSLGISHRKGFFMG